MRTWPERRGAAPLPALLARASAWLLEPVRADAAPPRGAAEAGVAASAEAAPGRGAAASADVPPRGTPWHGAPTAPAPDPPRPIVAVLGLAPRAGASTVARALAGRLARLDPAGVAVLFTADPPRAPISAAAAGRLARLAAEAGCEHARAVGRLCVVPASEPVSPLAARRPAPLVVDPGHGVPAEGVVALADHVVLVSTPDSEPALAAAVEASLREADRAVSPVVSRVLGEPPVGHAGALAIPESRIAAQLTLACREPRGRLGAAVAEAGGAKLHGGAPMSERGLRAQRGQASILLLGVLATLIAMSLVLAAFGQALGGRGRVQRVADLAAISGAHAMRDAYPRLFEAPLLRPGVPNPRHLSRAEYLQLARSAAIRAARRNGQPLAPDDVRFPDASSFAPARIAITVRDRSSVRVSQEHRRRIPVRARAEAELSPPADDGLGARGHGEYTGPLAYRQGKPMRRDVAAAFDRMQRAASAAGVRLVITSAFRSNAEQAVLFARRPDPRWVAPPGRSLHRLGTELDLGPPSAYGWLARNAPRFGFVKRYSWEPWHFGYTRSPGTASVGFGVKGGDGKATAAIQSFVPARYAPMIARAAQRWGVSAQLLAAQIYAESNFNPFARSPAGALGIAQFMPGTARGIGLRNPFDPRQAIDAQGHLIRDLLRRFGSVPLALAAYNAGPGAVARCGCIPPYAETRGYVARILGLLGGAGEGLASGFNVRLVE